MATQVDIVSEPRPQKGQKHRSSENFSLNDLNPKYDHLKWSCPEGVHFKVMQDLSGKKDDTKESDVYNNFISKRYDDRNLYISDPVGTEVPFTISVTPCI